MADVIARQLRPGIQSFGEDISRMSMSPNLWAAVKRRLLAATDNRALHVN